MGRGLRKPVVVGVINAFVLIALVVVLEVGFRAYYFSKLTDYAYGIQYRLEKICNSGKAPEFLCDWLPTESRVLSGRIEAIRPGLVALNAVFENAPQHESKILVDMHNTPLTRPHPDLGYELRPDTQVDAYMLRSGKAMNLDPPVLYLPRQATALPSDVLAFIDSETRLAYSYTIGSQGHRTTLPAIQSGRRLLIVGDSVAFGVGVDDNHTMASALQQRLGDEMQVINAGVGGYDGYQAWKVAKGLAEGESFDTLVYLACQNDFFSKEQDAVTVGRAVTEKFASLRDKFGGNLVIVLETYMEYSLRDLFQGNYRSWSKDRIRQTDELRSAMANWAGELGFKLVDWHEIVQDHMRLEKSIFSRFGLYADHAHLSPLGNRLMADAVYKVIADR